MSVAEPQAPPNADAEDFGDAGPLPPGVVPGTPGGFGLYHGMRMRRPEYHRRYEAAPPGFRAELIGGRVYINRDADGRAGGDLWDEPGDPLGSDSVGTKRRHGGRQNLVDWWLGEYLLGTPVPGLEALAAATVLMDDGGEPEPDAILRRLTPEQDRAEEEEHGGWAVGPPGLAVEVSDSTRRRDAGPKREDYERNGVPEYLMLDLPGRRVRWHARGDDGAYAELPPDTDGLLRSREFPGLWLDPAALLAGDRPALKVALAAGLASPEHAAFVAAAESGAAESGAAE